MHRLFWWWIIYISHHFGKGLSLIRYFQYSSHAKGLTKEIAGLTSRGEPEFDAADITPDTDTDSVEHLSRNVQGSFKRPAPLMGNRSLESRNSKRAQYHPQSCQPKKEPSANSYQSTNANNSAALTSPNMHAPAPPVTVGALEVQNVKKAINRYGTLPKGARIGAYLGKWQ